MLHKSKLFLTGKNIEVAAQTKVIVDTAAEEAKGAIYEGKQAATDFANDIKTKIEEAQKAIEKVAADSGKTMEQLKTELGKIPKSEIPPKPPVPGQ